MPEYATEQLFDLKSRGDQPGRAGRTESVICLSTRNDKDRLRPVGMAYRCDTSVRCTFIGWDGDVTPEQWNGTVGTDHCGSGVSARTAPGCRSQHRGWRAEYHDDVVAEMAQRWREHAANLGKMRWAIIPNGASDKARNFEMELEGSGIRTMVFNDTSVACTWLGLDTNEARTILSGLREALRRTS
jgi:hypothetical protein